MKKAGERKTDKRPLKKGAAKVPVVMQMEALECGAACLAMILAYYGKWIPLERVRVDCGVSRDGSNAKNVLVAARSYGLKAEGLRTEPEGLRRDVAYPCIIHWNFNHFVVLDGFQGDHALINDPARGLVRVSAEEFDRAFTGICLTFEPTDEFVPEGKPRSILSFAAKRLKGAGAAVGFVIATSLIASLFGLLRPAFSRVFVDRLLTGRNPSWAVPFLIMLACFTGLQIFVSWIRTIYALKINGKLDVIGSTSYLWEVLHKPMDFFSQRMAGDIQQRKEANATVAADIVNIFAPLVLDSFMMIFYLIVMLRASVVLSIMGLVSIIVNEWFSRILSKKRVNITRVQMRDAGKLSGQTVAGIEMVESIKASGAEDGFFARWAGYQASVNRQSVRFEYLNVYFGMIPGFVSMFINMLILLTGIWFVMNDHFTIGLVMNFQVWLGAFTQPAEQLISAQQKFQEMRTQMERIEDVMDYPKDEAFSRGPSGNDEEKDFDKLRGEIRMNGVTFGYSRLAKPLIRDFTIHVKPGGCVAFVGSSGCGKSTLSRLISGLYHPWEGEILFDGRPIETIDRNVFTSSVAVVDQDIILFEDTIANNIRMWDSSIENFEMILAARDAQIHDDIMKREGGYSYKITEGGRDFSGGQRQRLEIARVLAQDPTIIILDEATSALDAKTEAEVIRAIRDRGITCIVIAHRLSTIRDCDEIIVLDHGNVVQRGTHEELYAQEGAYRELVTSE